MGNRQPTRLRGIECSVPKETFEKIAQKWRKKLNKKFRQKKDYDSALVNEGYLICQTDASLLPEYMARLKREKLERHTNLIARKYKQFFTKSAPGRRRLGPKISSHLLSNLRVQHGNDREVNVVLAAYALIGFETKNGDAMPGHHGGDYLNGDSLG